MPDFKIERQCQGLVCGIDEAGRGPLAGPVVAAAVILEPRRFPKMLRDELDDSKVLTREQREACYGALRRCTARGAARIGVGAASTAEIDRLNILRAALLAMARAVAVLVNGRARSEPAGGSATSYPVARHWRRKSASFSSPRAS